MSRLIKFAILISWAGLLAGPSYAQVLYLSPYTGNGSEETPFRAHGVGQGAECKSLRPDETQLAGYALCEGPTVPVARGVIDLSGKRAITKADRDAILEDRGLSVSATTFDGLLSELVDKQGVSLKRKAGRERIYVKGHEVWSRSAPLASYLRDIPTVLAGWFSTAQAWAAATITETFTCANDSDGTYNCDHTWQRHVGCCAEIKNNALVEETVNSTQRLRLTSTAMDSTDMLVRATVTTLTVASSTNVAAGTVARHPNSTTGTYVYCVLRNGTPTEAEFGHAVSGVNTVDGSQSITFTPGDTVEVRAFDDQLSCAHNSAVVLGPITENTGDGNLYIGARFSGSGTDGGQVRALDNIFASNSLPGGATVRRRAIMLP